MLDLYFDQQVSAVIARGLRRLGVDVLTAAEDDRADADDWEILFRATALQRIVFTSVDFLIIGRAAQSRGTAFAGIVYGHQLRVTIGEAIRDLHLICSAMSADEMSGQIVYLPL